MTGETMKKELEKPGTPENTGMPNHSNGNGNGHPFPGEGLKALFVQLLNQWREETKLSSKYAEINMHQAHLQIIGLGEPVVPYILEDLSHGGGQWFTALRAITRANPVKKGHEQNAKLMRADWLAWGKENGLV